jgi:pSer/pThr/pTyr-binding forkhead associated (FHA) protein
VTSCAFCGRDNDGDSRYCSDCGKAIRVGTAAPPPGQLAPPAHMADIRGTCPRCGNETTSGLPFCGHCGALVGRRVSVSTTPVESNAKAPAATALFSPARAGGPRLALLGDDGHPQQWFTLDRGEAVIGRGEVDMPFPSDAFMSPMHARFDAREDQLWVRDLGSRNGTWVFIDGPTRLTDNDLLLIGSQIVRFRRLGYPGPHPPEADATRRMGSVVPTVDVAVLEQLRADGSVRDVFHLSPGRTVTVGRESGDWLFSYDATMSGRHAEIRTEDSDFFVHDANSRNGVAMAVRGERALHRGQRLLIGDQILRLESV